MKIGDKVMLKETSKWNTGHSNNPVNVEGEIYEAYGEPYSIGYNFEWRVKWSNGEQNVYAEHDLNLMKINLIGKISGVDWSKAPEWATHCHPSNKFFYKLNADGDMLAGGDGDGYECHDIFKGWVKRSGQGCISKEDDLQLETKPKYSSLQELPVGTFVKWTGDDYYQIYVKGKVDTDKCMAVLEGFAPWSQLGFNVSYDSFYLPRCTYSDKYDGEYLPFAEEGEAKPEQPVPQAIKDGWKIKHIKSPNYKCGRDVAVTILYREAGSNVFEYKYAITSTKDMFCRKIGVQTALNKKESWHLQTSKDILFREILSDICKVPYTYTPSPEFKLLKLWYNVNH